MSDTEQETKRLLEPIPANALARDNPMNRSRHTIDDLEDEEEHVDLTRLAAFTVVLAMLLVGIVAFAVCVRQAHDYALKSNEDLREYVERAMKNGTGSVNGTRTVEFTPGGTRTRIVIEKGELE